MSTAAKQDATRVITPAAILSYPWVDSPQQFEDDGTGKPSKPMYSAVLVFDPDTMKKYARFGTSIDALRAAANAAGVAKFGEKYAGLLRNPNFRSGFRTDAEDKGYPAGSTFVNSRNERRPGLVYLYPAADGRPAVVLDDDVRDAFYPGAIVRASLRAFGYDKRGNKGVSFALNNLQLIDGTAPRLDSRKAAEDDFEADATAAPAPIEGVE